MKLKGCFFCAGTGGRTGLHPMSPGWCTLSRMSYAALPRYCRNFMPFSFTMLDETVETRRPWRGSPCPAIRGRAFLCIVCIIQQYLSSFAIRSRARACPSLVSRDEAPYAVVECKLRGGQCREKYEKYMLKKEKILMTKHCLYATINSKHYISVSGTT